MELYDAIFYRKSIREYSYTKLNSELMDIVNKICKETKGFNNDLNIEAHFVARGHMIELTLGKKNKIKAPHYIVITSNEGDNYLENVGFIGQEIILKLTSLGLATCWVENLLNRRDIEEIINIKDEVDEDGEIIEEKIAKPLAIIALGYPKDGVELFRNKETKINRKSKKDISKNMKGKIEIVLDAVRLAPSFENLQPWKIYKKNQNIMFYQPKQKKKYTILSKISMGIFIKHFEIACNNYGIEFEISDEKFKNKINKEFIKNITLL